MPPSDEEAPRRVGQHFIKPSQRRRRVAVLVAVVAVVAAALAAVDLSSGGHSSPARAARAATGAHATSTTAAGQPTTTSVPAANLTANGPDGVTSTAIVAENAKPGTTAWRISGQPSTGFIQAFADTTYASVGQTVGLYVSTSSPSFVVHAYRMGWYGGTGGREVWTSPPTPGNQQPACPTDHSTNMVSCSDWSKSLALPITTAFVQGDYMLKLVGSGGQQTYVLLTVWDPNSTATYLVMARSLTEAGWNTYGGYDFYQGTGPCILGQTGSYPPCNRARVVSFDRPSDPSYISSDFLSNEYPLVELMEKDGLDVSYCTDVTVDADPSMLLAHKAVLSLGHDETWTYREREGAQVAFQHGVNFLMGAATMVRHARLQSSPLGPDREVVDYRDYAEDPLYRAGTDPMDVTGNTWSSPPANWSQIPFTGEEYSGYLNGVNSEPFVVADAASWVFQGTGLQDGSSIPGVIESDFDHLDPSGGSPANVDVLGHSPVSLTLAFTGQGEWGGKTYSDMTYYTSRQSGAGAIDTGTTNWIYALASCSAGQPGCGAADVAAITENVLRVFGQGPAGRTEPSTGDWRSITPPGS